MCRWLKHKRTKFPPMAQVRCSILIFYSSHLLFPRTSVAHLLQLFWGRLTSPRLAAAHAFNPDAKTMPTQAAASITCAIPTCSALSTENLYTAAQCAAGVARANKSSISLPNAEPTYDPNHCSWCIPKWWDTQKIVIVRGTFFPEVFGISIIGIKRLG